MLNKEQAMELFAQEAVLFGSVDGVPIGRLTEIFGEEAVQFSMRMNHAGVNYNSYGDGAYDAIYFYLSGFFAAATYANIQEIKAHKTDKAAK